MFEAIVFAVIECGFIPRCALEISNSAKARMDKIFDVIGICEKHTKFRAALPSICAGASLEPAKLTFQDLTHTIEIYLTTPPSRKHPRL